MINYKSYNNTQNLRLCVCLFLRLSTRSSRSGAEQPNLAHRYTLGPCRFLSMSDIQQRTGNPSQRHTPKILPVHKNRKAMTSPRINRLYDIHYLKCLHNGKINNKTFCPESLPSKSLEGKTPPRLCPTGLGV